MMLSVLEPEPNEAPLAHARGGRIDGAAPFADSSEDRSIGELFGKLGEETGTLIRQEVNLAAIEMTEKASAASKQALVIAVGSLFGAVSLMSLTAALIIGLSRVMDLWMSALLVGVALALGGYGVVSRGVAALRQMSPTPSKTLATWKESKSWAQELVR